MRKFILALLFFLTLCQCHKPEKIVPRSLPKGGSHLLLRVMYLVTGEKYGLLHLAGDEHLEEGLRTEKTIVNMRDPRDVMISMVNFSDKRIAEGLERGKPFPAFKPLDSYEPWMRLTFEEKLTAVITLDDRLIPFWGESIRKNFDCLRKLVEEKRENILFVKFENLVGEKGGGDAQSQQCEIARIAQFARVHLSQERLDTIAQEAWGIGREWDVHEVTFSKGTIGRWHGSYTPEQIKLFKAHWNQYLLVWGYETSEDW
ncbi:MAG: sulfotransferase domain-containing protein [Chlamydiales bacterium]